jgi:hypothetical protein
LGEKKRRTRERQAFVDRVDPLRFGTSMASRNDDKNNEDGVGLLKKKTLNSLCESKNVNVEGGEMIGRYRTKTSLVRVLGESEAGQNRQISQTGSPGMNLVD